MHPLKLLLAFLFLMHAGSHRAWAGCSESALSGNLQFEFSVYPRDWAPIVKRASQQTNPRSTLRMLSSIAPAFESLWETSDSGTTLRKHTLKVMRRFEEQSKLRPVFETLLVDYRGLLRLGLALHDIGKAVSVQRHGNSSKQKEYTRLILDTLQEALGIPERDRSILDLMIFKDISTDVYGFRNQFHSERAEEISKTGPSFPLNASQKAALQLLMVVADASSHPNILPVSFTVSEENGLLQFHPGDPMYASLEYFKSISSELPWESFFASAQENLSERYLPSKAVAWRYAQHRARRKDCSGRLPWGWGAGNEIFSDSSDSKRQVDEFYLSLKQRFGLENPLSSCSQISPTTNLEKTVVVFRLDSSSESAAVLEKIGEARRLGVATALVVSNLTHDLPIPRANFYLILNE